jgi:hypothetical protein
MVDVELLSARGDLNNLMAQFAGLLAAFSFVLAIYLVPPIAFHDLPRAELASAAWGTHEFLISTTIAVVGMFTVVCWDALLPSRRDSVVLGMLPIRTATIFRAKVAAIGSALGMAVVAVNSFTGLSIPFSALPPGPSWLVFPRAFLAYWIAMAAAGIFVFCVLLAAQGIAAQLLPYAQFLKVSGFLQVIAFFLVLAVYFLTPGSSDLQLNARESLHLIGMLPSFWFLALFQKLNGVAEPAFEGLAARAIWALGIALMTASVTYTLSYWRTLLLMIEQPDIAPSDRKHAASPLLVFAAGRLVKTPLERAVLLFIARTIGRCRQQRNILAAFTGIGLAISLTFAKGMLYGDTQMYAEARRYGFRPPRWDEPNVPLLAAGFVMLILAVIGMRAVFSLPTDLKSNWIFRVTDVHSPKAYFTAVRKSVFLLAAAPVWITAAMVYLALWPRVPALAHLAVLLMVGTIVIETSLREFRKFPFACSYLPGKSDLRFKFGIYAIGFLFATYVGAVAERNILETAGRTLVLFTVLAFFASRARGRWAAFAGSPTEQLQFEDVETPEVSPLNLLDEGAYGRAGQKYLDVLSAPVDLTLAQRSKAFAKKAGIVALAAASVGAMYERIGEWRDRDRFPIVGRRVDIGGRSLNIFCSGEWITAHAFQVRGGAATAKEIYEQCREEAIAAGTFGDRPLIVLTAGLPTQVGTSPVEERRYVAEQAILVDIQANLARLSARGKQVVVHDARHTIHYDRPDVVIGAVREVVEDARTSSN